KVLFGQDLKETVSSMVDDVIEQAVERFAGELKYSDEWDLPAFLSYIEQSIIPQPDFQQEDLRGMRKTEVAAFLAGKTHTLYEQREK
ncbi:MAG TPA: preprotein translocase subunit SecA, partial [Syntrophomonas wolfei]|nr:preprotein translocase subunit SecA [Syntrophomonas wolfei]